MASFLEKKKTAAQIVANARGEEKVSAQELLAGVFDDFLELHGDRLSADDAAIIGGVAHFEGKPVTVILTNKGKSAQERLRTHFGCPEPAGYRKSLRLIKQAEKFKRPVVTFINTAGAYPGQSAEENGQGEAIARNLLEISSVKVPVIAVIYGEGGSGGALAFACGDSVWMFENSMYSVLSPEGFAAILWKDSSRADEAAEVMQLTPEKLLQQKVIDGIIPESRSHKRLFRAVKKVLQQELEKYQKLSASALVEKRQQRFQRF
ncbi:acetyl-CoA carboxylase carboxyl transferase subunit alpha [Liquorilactobacillus satsumensis]|uniref:acetyl-CoA carboxylase carboxyltransferase subunit alpha n=1 Tax=Liquorilactobacillus satsumensis TaxID=259059 RepID=UPI0021C4359B|nr:carboxyltransferase subunit alpha [Liquorilactobacillus satsumensis]MCP9312653.1 acetyl-CoA carboxylase carboxyl transferase subunit alpha [Liquorilactobacillus satsumensis]MCP9359839.1 acetyl-CoA carboxylase carboxyl transferase subunit alpha [Liquorilactobacillus satsumensis]